MHSSRIYDNLAKCTVVWENFTVGIFHVKKFMLKYFHLLGYNLGYKYVHLLPIYPKVKIFRVLNFHPRRLQTKILTVNFSQTTVNNF